MDGKSKPVIDPDVPPLSTERIMRMRPATEVLPKKLLDAQRRRREAVEAADDPPLPAKAGRPKLAQVKRAISIRLDPDVIEGWRNTGPHWQTRMNLALRKALQQEQNRQAKVPARKRA